MRVEPGETAWSANQTDTEKQVEELYDGMDLDVNGILPSEEYVHRSNEWCLASLHRSPFCLFSTHISSRRPQDE